MTMRHASAAKMVAVVSLAGSLARPVLAQATPTVPLSDAAYRDVKELYAAGLVDSISVGTRPYSRAQFARIAAEVSPKLAGLDSQAAVTTLWAAQRLHERLRTWGIDSEAVGSASPVRFLDDAAFDVTVLSSPARAVAGNGIGEIAADLQPIAAGHEGVPLHDGTTVGIQTTHVLPLSRYAVLVARPRLYSWVQRGDGERRAAARLEEFYVRVVLARLAFAVGREHVVWGEGREGGVTLSSSAPALDLVRFGTDRPLRLPWLLAAAGPTSFDAFVADLGADQNYPHAKLVGWRGTVRPWHWFELSLHTLDHMGGRGAPRASFADRVVDAFPIIDALITSTDLTFSNKLAGGDLRVRLPGSRDTEAYFEQTFDDFDIRRIWSSVWQDGGHVLGVASLVPGSDRLRVRVEGHNTGLRYYEHTQFISGVTMHRSLLGDPLGPNGASGLLSLDWQRGRRAHTVFDFVIERRSGDRYKLAATGPNFAGFGFVRTAILPKERRFRLVITDEHLVGSSRLAVDIQGGAERVNNFGYVAGDSRTDLIARVVTRYTFR